MKAFRKSSVPQLDIEAAGRILAQAFEANQMELNTIPLEVLASYSNYRRERFTLQRTILVIIMTLFLLLPFLFVPPFPFRFSPLGRKPAPLTLALIPFTGWKWIPSCWWSG